MSEPFDEVPRREYERLKARDQQLAALTARIHREIEQAKAAKNHALAAVLMSILDNS